MIEVIGGLLLMALMAGRSDTQSQLALSQNAMIRLLGVGVPTIRLYVLLVAVEDEYFLEDRLDRVLGYLASPVDNPGFEILGQMEADSLEWVAVVISLSPAPKSRTWAGIERAGDLANWAFSLVEGALMQDHVDQWGEKRADHFQGDFEILGWSGPGAPDQSPGPGDDAEALRLLGILATEEDIEEILHENMPGTLSSFAEADPKIDLFLRDRWVKMVARGDVE